MEICDLQTSLQQTNGNPLRKLQICLGTLVLGALNQNLGFANRPCSKTTSAHLKIMIDTLRKLSVWVLESKSRTRKLFCIRTKPHPLRRRQMLMENP